MNIKLLGQSVVISIATYAIGKQVNKLPGLRTIVKKYPKFAKYNGIVGSIVSGVNYYFQQTLNEEAFKNVEKKSEKCSSNFHVIPVCPNDRVHNS